MRLALFASSARRWRGDLRQLRLSRLSPEATAGFRHRCWYDCPVSYWRLLPKNQNLPAPGICSGLSCSAQNSWHRIGLLPFPGVTGRRWVSPRLRQCHIRRLSNFTVLR